MCAIRTATSFARCIAAGEHQGVPVAARPFLSVVLISLYTGNACHFGPGRHFFANTRREGSGSQPFRARGLSAKFFAEFCRAGHGRRSLAMRSTIDFSQVQAHRCDVAKWQRKGCPAALLRTDSAKDIGLGVVLVLRCRRRGAAPRPAAGDAILLPDAGFVGEPDLYCISFAALLAGDPCQRGREFFLSMLRSHGFTQPALHCCFSSIFTRSAESI